MSQEDTAPVGQVLPAHDVRREPLLSRRWEGSAMKLGRYVLPALAASYAVNGSGGHADAARDRRLRLTHPDAIANLLYLRNRELGLRVPFALQRAPLVRCVDQVGSGVAEEQVVGVHAQRHVAMVEHVQSAMNRAAQARPRDAVRELNAVVEQSVSGLVLRAGPQPARIRL